MVVSKKISQNKVSIIVPCFNQSDFLDECLNSVYKQTYKNWECIIVNDGSTDNTDLISRKWIEIDKRFKYVQKENGGLSSARNAGLSKAEGDFIQFLDSDDLLNQQKLELQLSFFSEMIDIVICDYFPFDNELLGFKRNRYMNPFPDVQKYKYQVIERWEQTLSIPCHCVLFRAKLLIRNSLILNFDESLPNHEDWVFWTKLFYFSSGIYNSEYCLVSYRIHNNSMCHDFDKMNEGFKKAAQKIKIFLESQNDFKGLQICEEKINSINGVPLVKKKPKFKQFISLFVPPILKMILKKHSF
jgi:glycosyltransferase involved in cell wall biosynthesis